MDVQSHLSGGCGYGFLLAGSPAQGVLGSHGKADYEQGFSQPGQQNGVWQLDGHIDPGVGGGQATCCAQQVSRLLPPTSHAA
jgi:hypothetical protein